MRKGIKGCSLFYLLQNEIYFFDYVRNYVIAIIKKPKYTKIMY